MIQNILEEPADIDVPILNTEVHHLNHKSLNPVLINTC